MQCLIALIHFTAQPKRRFNARKQQQWRLMTTNYVVHETWALIQHRLGWDALDDFLEVMLPLCELVFVDQTLHSTGVQRCRDAHLRNLSLTDCISFECMKRLTITEAIAKDAHFEREQISLP